MLISVTDRDTGFQAYLMIDSTINGRSYGGVRTWPEFSFEILRDIAHTMTLKHGFLGLPLGGAKALIVAPPDVDPDEKKRLMWKFGQGLKPFITTRSYVPAGDLGVYDADIRYLLKSVGIHTRPRGSFDTSGFYTGLTVCAAGIAVARHLDLNMNKATVAVEGFGAVGSSAALAYQQMGLKVVGVSTRLGALYSEQGLNIPELLDLKKQVGDRVVQVFEKAEKMDAAGLTGLNVDILSPCAHSHSIDSQKAGKVSARILAPGANAPVTGDGESILVNKGVFLVPDFVANCGGALGTTMHVAGLGDSYIKDFISSKYSDRITGLIRKAEEKQISLKSYVTQQTEEKFLRIKNEAEKKSISQNIMKMLLELYHYRVIPSFAVKIIAPANFERRFVAD
jgi:glutamate dehydrogenase/leucine dehydrogenase